MKFEWMRKPDGPGKYLMTFGLDFLAFTVDCRTRWMVRGRIEWAVVTESDGHLSVDYGEGLWSCDERFQNSWWLKIPDHTTIGDCLDIVDRTELQVRLQDAPEKKSLSGLVGEYEANQRRDLGQSATTGP